MIEKLLKYLSPPLLVFHLVSQVMLVNE